MTHPSIVLSSQLLASIGIVRDIHVEARESLEQEAGK